VKLDEQLRNAKIWYRDLGDSNKFELLSKEAQKAGVTINEGELVVTDEEDNPFYELKRSEETFSHLVEQWMKAEDNWRESIVGKFEVGQIDVERLVSERMDLGKKGFLVLEDVVRFMNLETGTFFRNRDLVMAFRRLAKRDQLCWK
jgi:hypothetical protein